MLTVSIIIPAFNEAATILPVLKMVADQSVDNVSFEVIVVNDGSTDATEKLIQDNSHLYSKAIHLNPNGGKGAAVRAGLLAATGDYILFQDADLEYDPGYFGKLMVPAIQFDADIVIGSRLLGGEYTRVHYFWHKIGNRMITLLFNMINNTTFTDIYSCYLMFRRSLLNPDDLETNGWEQQAEILSRIIGAGGGIYFETPIGYNGRTYSEGKKIRAKDTLAVTWAIIRYRFSRTRRGDIQ